ncbi:hypothetical protein GALMADRAFT_148852 [Galerina marginata CBS 339.88]|uniref:Uncharacterized protein n=1 Tax=Galerina marginata (strain CBS 339.88) TaxID=685588 RepID=A0A067SBU2_GALM3|nr:hypothetical protein GALMADRAFT_148852 [Galerina marginata CBS 339.88]
MSDAPKPAQSRASSRARSLTRLQNIELGLAGLPASTPLDTGSLGPDPSVISVGSANTVTPVVFDSLTSVALPVLNSSAPPAFPPGLDRPAVPATPIGPELLTEVPTSASSAELTMSVEQSTAVSLDTSVPATGIPVDDSVASSARLAPLIEVDEPGQTGNELNDLNSILTQTLPTHHPDPPATRSTVRPDAEGSVETRDEVEDSNSMLSHSLNTHHSEPPTTHSAVPTPAEGSVSPVDVDMAEFDSDPGSPLNRRMNRKAKRFSESTVATSDPPALADPLVKDAYETLQRLLHNSNPGLAATLNSAFQSNDLTGTLPSDKFRIGPPTKKSKKVVRDSQSFRSLVLLYDSNNVHRVHQASLEAT